MKNGKNEDTELTQIKMILYILKINMFTSKNEDEEFNDK